MFLLSRFFPGLLMLLWLSFAPVANGGTREIWQGLDKSMLVWGSFNLPSSVVQSDANNAKFEIYAKPTIGLFQFSKKTKLVGYTLFTALRDKQKLDYNSKVTYALGVEIQHRLSPAVRLSFGVKQASEYQYFIGRNYSSLVATADVSVYKTLEPDWVSRHKKISQLVLSGWGNIRYPGSLDPSEKDNPLIQGSIKLAAIIPIRNSKLKLAPFGSLLAKADLEGRPWNNTVEPALGIDLKIPLGKKGSLSIGAKAGLQIVHTTGKTEGGGLAYLSWFLNF